MHRHIGRAELIERLVPELRRDHESETGQPADALDAFSKVVLRRVDDKYLYRHRLTTLGAQLRDSFKWVSEHGSSEHVVSRVFTPSTKSNGYTLEGFVVETLMPDQPFIVDTIKLLIEQAGLRLLNSLHVVVPTMTDATGRFMCVDGREQEARHLSYTRWYFAHPSGSGGDLAEVEPFAETFRQRLELSRSMVRDFFRMLRTVKDLANEFDYLSKVDANQREVCLEVRDFLNWLGEDHFVFMSISFYARADAGGIEIDERRTHGQVGAAPELLGVTHKSAHEFLGTAEALGWPLLRVVKSTAESLVHRPGKVDTILVRLFDDQGVPTGGVAIRGLFTFKGLQKPGAEIPILRRKLARLIDSEAIVTGGYEYKSLVNAFNTLPVEYLFEAGLGGIRELLEMIVAADATREINCQVVLNDDARSAYAFIVLPKEHYTDNLRVDMQSALRGLLRSSYVDHRVYLGKFGTVALHFYLTGGEDFGHPDMDAVEETLVQIGTPWTYRLHRALENEHGENRAAELYSRYAEAFPEGYTDLSTDDDAVVDIGHLEKVAESGRLRFDMFEHPTRSDQALLRIYSREAQQLTAILPVVDNFGVVVLEQVAFDLRPAHVDRLTVNTLRILRGEHDVVAQQGSLINALRSVFGRKMRSDRFNRLLLVVGLTWQEVDLFRAMFHYSRQIGLQFDAEIVQKVLLSHREFAVMTAELWRVRFDPETDLDDEARAARAAELTRRAEAYLDNVKGFEEDRILRLFLELVSATLRTNFYRTRDDDEHFLSLKLDCAMIREMPDPRPMFEIYVHHARMEGVHLRGGRVARGGIRWSDRLDDYRSEVLGLMATQMLKNTLIVPVGAKGGFILKDPVDDWSEARARADRLYRIFIRGLLEVTDNLVDGDIVPPERVVRHDADDPYLVVAADKGTAHLSDTANAVAATFDFWLGDAFASGGSVGYDHKIKGITARGAWVCVRHSFRELGIDPELDPITVVGIGDMSGDVFGNGMLLSRSMKMVAAFNHMHIFLDPTPDPEVSWAERQRLFAMGRSRWTDYDETLISDGGGIFDRSAKAIKLSDPVRALLNTRETELSGEEVIKHILTADVDLLWNGGIGTYVKSTSETHQDVEDAANDRVRVDAAGLRCRVIGEGGNLGITMRGRVEFASSGGLINLDAIDNSGGVDLSDHEVNIKVLLQPLVAHGGIEPEARRELLARVGDWVCEQVLENNQSQSLAISLDEVRSREDIWAPMRATEFLKERLGFSRRDQRLPRNPQLLEGRLALNQGWLRPELAKLLSFSKMLAHAALVDKPVATREQLRPFLEAYFPPEVVAVDPTLVGQHMLFNELAATLVVNHVVDLAGVTFYPTMMAGTERSVQDITAAYLIAEKMLGAGELRAAIRSQQPALPVKYEYAALLRIERALADAVRWLLGLYRGPLNIGDEVLITAGQEVARHLDKKWLTALPEAPGRELRSEIEGWHAAGLPMPLATRVAALSISSHAPALVELARKTGHKPSRVAGAYFAAGAATRVFSLVKLITEQSFRVSWDRMAVETIRRTLFDTVLRLAEVLASGRKRVAPANQLTRGLEEMPHIKDFRLDVQRVLKEQIPVSAMFVLSGRLRQRVSEIAASRGE